MHDNPDIWIFLATCNHSALAVSKLILLTMKASTTNLFVHFAALVLLVPFASASAASVTYIDMLQTKQTNSTYDSSMTNTIASATSLGNFRTVTTSSTGNSINDETSSFRVLTNAPAGPRVALTSGTDATANFEMKWGGAGGTTGLGGIDFTGALGTDFSRTKSTLNFSLLNASITSAVTWTFVDTSNNTATYTQSIPVNLAPSPAIDYAVSLASFTGSGIIDWTSINFITLSGGGVPSLNMTFAAPFSVAAHSNVGEPPVTPSFSDSDGDGVNNLRENADGTDPNDANSFNPLSRGLVAYYPFNGSVNDESGVGNHATNNGASPTLDRFGTATNAYNFNGTNAYVSAPPLISDFQRNVTLSCWIKTSYSGGANEQSQIASAVTKPRDWGDYGGVSLEILGGKASFGFNNDLAAGTPSGVENWRYDSTFSVADGYWHQLVQCIDANGIITAYVDGRALTSHSIDSFQPVLGSAPLQIGRGGAARYFPGALDDVRVYNRSLSSDEVADLYQSEAGNLDSDGDGLTDAWERGFGRYQIVQGNFTWDQSKADAESRGGHLATITSQAEWNFIWSELEPTWGGRFLLVGRFGQGNRGNLALGYGGTLGIYSVVSI